MIEGLMFAYALVYPVGAALLSNALLEAPRPHRPLAGTPPPAAPPAPLERPHVYMLIPAGLGHGNGEPARVLEAPTPQLPLHPTPQ